MPHGHSHGTHGENQSSDFWTKLSAGVNSVASYLSNTYWLYGCINALVASVQNLINAEDEPSAEIYGSAVLAAVLALGVAAGDTYCHYQLNKSHETTNSDIERQCLNINGEQAEGNAKLSLLQTLALIGDYVSHVGDIAAPLTFIAQLVADNKDLFDSPEAALIINTILFVIGSLGSVADVRTCKRNLQEMNEKQPQTQSDSVTKDYCGRLFSSCKTSLTNLLPSWCAPAA